MPEHILETRSSGVARQLAGIGLAAGAAGGLAEVLWVWVIAPVAGGNPVAVAQGVSETLFPAIAAGSVSIALGLFIHFALAMALGVVVALGVRWALPALAGSAGEFGLIVALLALIWVINFGVVLPLVNPAFVVLLPLWASLASKLLFGVFAATAMRMLDTRSASEGK